MTNYYNRVLIMVLCPPKLHRLDPSTTVKFCHQVTTNTNKLKSVTDCCLMND